MRSVLPFRALTVAFACILGLAIFPLGLQAQEVDMKRYITLTVKKGATIVLSLSGLQNNTLVRIVNGKTDFTTSVDSTIEDVKRRIDAKASTMTIYGRVSHLNCSNNGENITALDVSHNELIFGLDCHSNQITSLDVSHNELLTVLICHKNQLSSLDVSHNKLLFGLVCHSNLLTSLNVGKNTSISSIDCSNNRLTSLDVSNNPDLNTLLCHTNRLTSLDVSRNTMLEGLYCYNNQIASLNLRNNQALAQLHCHNNRLTSLDVSRNPELKAVDCSGNQLTALDVSKNSQLTVAFCWGNRLSTDAWNRFFCSLPDRSYMPNEQIIYPLDNRSDSQKPQVLAANGNIAKRKGWEVSYYNDGQDTPITGFTGSYRCTKTYK